MQRFILNLKGVKCPDFGLTVRAFFRDLNVESEVEIHSDAHNANRDIKALCEFGGHELKSVTKLNDIEVFTVRKGA